MPSEELPKGRTELLQVLQGQGDKETLDFESKAQEGPAWKQEGIGGRLNHAGTTTCLVSLNPWLDWGD